ncbi:HDOD domain-containing protein [Halioxenophilus sp. WMMB6]|uniref:HDOD domain-containing protein n=1 Tax=Halioxenophilus sp. WMMB6 TaxID=3073815 RepID=UPI00295F3D9F|nr:HDOD domain-containing protein [Halioxenophilus sp. WMMB6]
MAQILEQVRNEILLAIKNDELVLPTLPEVALRVRDVAMDPEATMDQLAKVIGNDPSLSARVIKVANSPIMRASRKIEDLQMALSRLGMDYTCNIATGLAMEQMFQATSDMVDKRLRQIWNRSAEVAGIAHVLCRHYTNLRPDQATLAGLVHQIGALPILTYAENHSALLKDAITLDTVIEKLGPAIGNRILATWDFPEEIRRIPSEHLDFTCQKPVVDYADVVTVAVLQSYAGTNHPLAKIDFHKVTAFARLGLDPDMQFAEGEDLSEDMAMAMELLK